MKTLFKIFGATILLLIIALVVTPMLFKKEIVQLVKDTANEELNAKVDFGDFDLTLISSFPDFSFSIDDVSVANVGEFEGDTLFSASQLALGLDLQSVLDIHWHKKAGAEYKINTIKIDQPRINVMVLKDSSANYDIAKASTDTTVAVEEVDTTEAAPFKLNLNKLEINNAYIVYDDALGDVYAKLDDFSYSLNGDLSAETALLKMLIEIDKITVASGGVKYLNKVNLRFKADIDADLANAKYTFKENELDLNALGLGFDGYVEMPSDDIRMDISFKVKETTFGSILSLVPGVYTADFADVKTSGSLALNGFAKGVMTDTDMPAFALNLLVKDARFQYPDLPKSVENIQVDLAIDNKTGVPDATIIDLNQFHIEMAGNPVDAKMHVSTPVSDANISGEVKMKMDLESVKDVVPMEKGDAVNGLIDIDVTMAGKMSSIEKEQYEEFDAKGSMAITDMNYTSEAFSYPIKIKELLMNFSPQYVELVKYDALVGKSDMQMDGRIDNFLQYALQDSLLKGTFNFSSTLLDVNELMAEDTTAVVVEAPTDTTEVPMEIVEVPSNLDVKLNSTIGKMLYDDYLITDVSGAVIIKDSKLTMDKLKLTMPDLEGTMVMTGVYNTQDVKKPIADFKMDMSDFDIAKSFETFNSVQQLVPIAQYSKGKFSTAINFTTLLDDKMEPVLSTLQGGGKLQTKSVVIEGFKPVDKLADALKQEKYKKLTVNDVDLSYEFVDGRVVVEETPIKLGKSKALVSGSTGFDQTIDYVWKLEIPRSEFGSQANDLAGGLLDQLNSQAGTNITMSEMVKVNVLFGGTVTEPTVKTSLFGGDDKGKGNVKEAVVEKVKAVVTETIDNAKEEARAQAQAEAAKIMKDAQAEADKIKADAKVLADKTKNEGYASVDKTISSTRNPIAKKAAQLAAPAAKKQVDKQVNDILKAANKKADNILVNAKAESDAKLKE